MVLAKAVPAAEPRSETVKKVAWLYAAILVVMTLGQLYAFEKFIPIIQEYGLPGGEATATLVAAVIVIVQVFALPFLLRMPLSPLMRLCSLVFSVLAPVIWLTLSIVGLGATNIDNAGILGEKVDVPVVLQAAMVAVLAVLAGVSAWGLAPRKKI